MPTWAALTKFSGRKERKKEVGDLLGGGQEELEEGVGVDVTKIYTGMKFSKE